MSGHGRWQEPQDYNAEGGRRRGATGHEITRSETAALAWAGRYMSADRRGTMGKHECQNDEPAVSTHAAEYGTFGIIQPRKILMEQSDRLGEITG